MKKLSIQMVALIVVASVFVGLVSISCTDEIVMYRVTFDSQGGDDVDSIDVIEGATIERPDNPTKAGYIFDGWYADEELTEAWDFENDTVTEAATLYAKWREPTAGDLGPSGGYIFYDDEAGFDFDDSGTVESDEKDLLDGTNDGTVRGDRYLEAAPSDIKLGTDDYWHIFGYYRTTPDGSATEVGTATGIGTGKTNTEHLVNAMGSTAYTTSDSTDDTTTGDYAAKLADDYSLTVGDVTYDDWFLPSKDELNLMYDNLQAQNPRLGGFSFVYYWSSSEFIESGAWHQYFTNGSQGAGSRENQYKVRPVRAF